MYLDYLDRIVDDYQEKRNAGTLPSALLNPTPGKIKRECVKVFGKRFRREDEKALREFYDYEGSSSGLSRRMVKFPALEFLTLNNFLKGKTEWTDDKNLELLGWLIGYEGFPYDPERDYTKKETPVKKLSEPQEE